MSARSAPEKVTKSMPLAANGPRSMADDDHGSERALHLAADTGRDRRRQKADAGRKRRHQHGAHALLGRMEHGVDRSLATGSHLIVVVIRMPFMTDTPKSEMNPTAAEMLKSRLKK